jgi:hypothetical protein
MDGVHYSTRLIKDGTVSVIIDKHDKSKIDHDQSCRDVCSDGSACLS